jgi:hypothetical protein
MRVPACTSIRGLIWAPSAPIQTSILRRQLCSRGSKILSYQVQTASRLSEQAVTSKTFSFSSLPLVLPPSDTLERNSKPGEGVGPKQHDVAQRPTCLKPPDRASKDPDEAGEACQARAPATVDCPQLVINIKRATSRRRTRAC